MRIQKDHAFAENGMLRLDAEVFPWFLLVFHFCSESSRCACSYVMFWYRSDGLAWIKAMVSTQGGWSSEYTGSPEGEAHARFPLFCLKCCSVCLKLTSQFPVLHDQLWGLNLFCAAKSRRARKTTGHSWAPKVTWSMYLSQQPDFLSHAH